MVLPKEFLKSIEVPYIWSIAISSEDYINYSSNLTQDLSENIIFLKMLSLLQQEFKSWNDKLSILHPKPMFRLEKMGVLSSSFLDLNQDVTPFTSWIFGTARRRQWRKKVNISGSIRKETENKSVAALSVNQPYSSQPLLVSKLSGKLTSACIWTAQVIVDLFSDLTYV